MRYSLANMTSLQPLAVSRPHPPRQRDRLARPKRHSAHDQAVVVHLTAECWPFARTGGLGEAVSTLASHHSAGSVPSVIVMPFYRQVRERAPNTEPCGAELIVQLGTRSERVRLWRHRSCEGIHDVIFVDHPLFAERAGLYGEYGRDYEDNAQRFALFCMAALTALPRITPVARVLHAHDWHTALAPVYLRTTFAGSQFHERLAAVLSVHNAAFQGHVPREVMPELGLPRTLYDWRLMEWYGRVNLLKGGLAFADVVTTVSETHASELRSERGGFGLHDAFAALGDRLVGIVNGIDQSIWDPTTDVHLAARYSAANLAGKGRCKTALQAAFGLARRNVPVVAMCARLTEQKGIDLVLDSALLARDDVQFVFLGEGEPRFADALGYRTRSAPDRIAAVTTFSDRLEHVLMAGADLFLLPSRFEPCGLAQMRAQRYGAIPVAHRVGGLADTIEDGVTGFLFDGYNAHSLESAVDRALERHADQPAWRRMMRAAMARDFGWSGPAASHLDVYSRVCERGRQHRPHDGPATP